MATAKPDATAPKKPRKKPEPRPLFLLTTPTRDENGNVVDLEVVMASRNAANVLAKLDALNTEGVTAKLKRVMAE